MLQITKTSQIVVKQNLITKKFEVLKFGTKVAAFNTLQEAVQYQKQYEVALRTGVGLVTSNRFGK